MRHAIYRELGIAPGIPTMKGSYGDPENTSVGYNTIIKELGDHSVPAEWAQYVKHNTEADTAPGAPIQWDDPSDPESAQPGYGFVADNSTEEETFYYHSDHLGSTSYITDKDGNITQYDAYLPYGELLVDEHSSSEEMPYKFNGKEFDEETGLYYYGARYMQPVASIWYGVDQLTGDYPNVSGYTYCLGNPIKLVDTDGKKPIPYKQLIARLRAINKLATFDKAWSRSHHGEKTVEEWGFVLTMTKNKRWILSRNLKTDHQDGSVVLNTKTPQNETLIGDVHTHPYNKNCTGSFGYIPGFNSGIARIKKGETDFDDTYSINYSEAKVEGLSCDYLDVILMCRYVGNGKMYGYGYAYALDPGNTNSYLARIGVPIIVDLYKKTTKVIEGLPRSNGHGVAMGLHNGKMYYGSANDEYNGFCTVDITTGKIETKVATVEGFPSFFYSFE